MPPPTESHSLLARFASHAPRERSGSRSANRFDYQISWAFSFLLSLHNSREDYLIVLDHHEDVVLFDSEDDLSASKMNCYQVKTRNKGSWTLRSLITVPKAENFSILGKLYSSRITFGLNVESVSLVSNAPFSVKTLDSPAKPVTVTYTDFSRLCRDSQKEASIALQQEHKLHYCPLLGVETVAFTDSLSLQEHRTTTLGRFTEFMESRNHVNCSLTHGFRAIFEELQTRNNYEGDITSVEVLKSKKGIGRKEFDGMIEKIARNSTDDEWPLISAQLTQDGASLPFVRTLYREWRLHQVQKLDVNNILLHQAIRILEKHVQQIHHNIEMRPILPFLQACLEAAAPELKTLQVPFTEHRLCVIILSVISE